MRIVKIVTLVLCHLLLLSCTNQSKSDKNSLNFNDLEELPSSFEVLENQKAYRITTRVKYLFEDEIDYCFNKSALNDCIVKDGFFAVTEEFQNEKITITNGNSQKTIYLSSSDGQTFKKDVVLAFGYDASGNPKYWPNYQNIFQNFDYEKYVDGELLFGDILSLTYTGEESWVSFTETYYGLGGYCWASPRTMFLDVCVIESTIVPFSFNKEGEFIPVDKNIIIQSYDMKNCPNSINNGLVAFNADGSLIELNKIEGQIIYGSCSQYNIQDPKEYRVHAFYTYYPR